MTAVARLLAHTLVLVTLGLSSACITTLCLSALCGEAQTQAQSAARASTPPLSERSGHNCDSMRF